MSSVNRDQIACFHCVRLVDRYIADGVEHVACSSCGRNAPLEKAFDDCFLFLVVAAINTRLTSVESHSYDFMPLQQTRESAWRDRAAMLSSGRAARAA